MKYYQIKENGKWDNTWYCVDRECSCGEWEIIEEFKNKGYKVRKVPFYIRVNFYYYRVYISFVLGVIIGFIINYLICIH